MSRKIIRMEKQFSSKSNRSSGNVGDVVFNSVMLTLLSVLIVVFLIVVMTR